MIEIFIIIGAGSAFLKYAKNNGLTPWVWAIVPAFSYYFGAIAMVFSLTLFIPDLQNDRLVLTAIGLFTGALFVGIAYFIMARVAVNKKAKITAGQSELLDEDLTF